MTTIHRRIALLAGASVSAFALASPALADHTTPAAGTYPGPDAPTGRVIVGVNAADTLVLCDLADANTDPDICFYGVVATGTGVVSALVVDPATGEVRQVGTATGTPTAGGNVDLDIVNPAEGHTTIGAIATATDAAGVANANAFVDTGIYQEGDGAGNILLDIDNDGVLTIRARATGTAADADATADIDQAIVQDGASTGATGVVTVTLTNDNDLNIDSSATANGTTSADATASMGALALGGGAIAQTAVGAGTGAVTARIDNNFDIDFTATSTAAVTAGTGVGNSTAVIGFAATQTVDSNGGGAALAELTSDGARAIDIVATANATGSTTDDAADLEADAVASGILQQVEGGGGTGGATARVSNNNAINIDAIANALDADLVDASASSFLGLYQLVTATGTGTGATGTAVYDGTGDLTVDVVGTARGDDAMATASQAFGVLQVVTAVNGVALASFDTTATSLIDFNVTATALGTIDADAFSNLSFGIYQAPTSTAAGATADLDIDGGLSMDNVAVATIAPGTAVPTTGAGAAATTTYGVFQTVTAGTDQVALARITNDSASTITADATANGVGFVTSVGDLYAADASATIAAGFAQVAFAADNTTTAAVGAGNTSFTSTGAVNVTADSDAVAVAGTPATADANARADAFATGVLQSANGTATFDNRAAFTVVADATASGVELAEADAEVIGIDQLLVDTAGTARFRSTGLINVTASGRATATGTGGVGNATADATGYSVTGEVGILDVDNDAAFNVRADSIGTTTAGSTAVGWLFEALNTEVTPTRQARLSGTVRNDSTLNVVAAATGAAGTAAGGTATATGILFTSGVNTTTLTNTGAIQVDAIVDAGGTAEANGIVVVGNATGTAPTAGQVMTINNSGVIRARESVNGGTTFRRGMAIDVAAAPNPVVINLLGGGNIFGDIDIGADDTIVVDNGQTNFDGTVNPECVALIGTDLAARAACTQGVLNITNDGTLVLRDNNVETPARIFVDTFTIVDGGVVAFELDGETNGTAAAGTYPQIFADTANLNGTLEGRLAFDGLFEDQLFFNNLIDANTRVGTFDTCEINGFEGSLLLDVRCEYDAGNNVDLVVDRVAFNDVAGLNGNGEAVGLGLECIYDPDMTGGMADLLSDLFLFTDAEQFNAALNQLSGAGYAGYLQSFSSLGVRYNDILDHATSCEVPALAGSVLECRTAPVHVWGQLDFQNRKTDGDNELGGYDSDRWTAVIGADFSVGGAAIVGASIGRVTNRVDFDRLTGTFKADGYQVGAYGVFDPGPFYVKALGTYNWFDGDADRQVDFGAFNFNTGATFGGQLRGDPDVRMWTLGLHAGARLPMGATAVITPYANLDHTNARMDGFEETGLNGANLTIYDARQKRTTLTAGAKFAGDIGGIVPELNLGYRHQFGDRATDFRAAFLGDEDCDFTILSEREKRGAILAGLSIGGKAGPVDVRVGYQGLFNNQSKTHAGNFRIILPFGGAPVVAAPAAEYVAPPPPPPAPVYEQPAPPPPPPPAPAGERGE